MHCHLVVPDLFWPDREAADVWAGVTAPSLERLLARGRRTTSRIAGFDGWLARAFGLADDVPLPAAPYRLAADGVTPSTDETWLCADPVHLRVDRDSLVLADATVLQVAGDEAAALVATLNAHFAPDGLVFSAPAPDRWYLRSPVTVDIPMTPIDLARGRPLDAIFPEGPAGGRWRALVNEVQMLLHQHPVNERREAAGRPAINSIWPWGAGRWQTLQPRARGTWWSDLSIPRGLARAASLATGTLPAGFAALAAAGPGEGIVHVVADGPLQAVARGDRDAWRAAVGEVEARWAAPALEALRARRIGMVSVHAPGVQGSLDVEVAGGDLRFFWRRPRPLASYVAAG